LGLTSWDLSKILNTATSPRISDKKNLSDQQSQRALTNKKLMQEAVTEKKRKRKEDSKTY